MMMRTHHSRPAFSLVEIIIAMTIALVISGVLFFTFFTNQRNAEKGMETLNYIRKATVLLEQLKQDIRASLKKKESVKADGKTVELERYLGKKTVKVSYKFDEQKHCVTRTEGGVAKDYGADGKLGNVIFFSCTSVKDLAGFYKIEVQFETYQEIMKGGVAVQTTGSGQGGTDKRVKNYTFQALVNKRAPEDSEKDIQWKYAFEDP